MSKTLRNLLDEAEKNKSNPKAKEYPTFGELFGLGAKSSLGTIKCSYIELLSYGDANGKNPKDNIVYSLQAHTFEKIESFLRENFMVESDDVALLMADTTQTPYDKTGRIVVKLNVEILAAIAEYTHRYPDRRDDVVSMYNALYIGEEGYRMAIGYGSKKYDGVFGLRDMFYINPKAVAWYPVVTKTVTVEQPTHPDGNTTESNPDVDVYEPEKTDTQVKKNNTKTLAMLAIAALSLFN